MAVIISFKLNYLVSLSEASRNPYRAHYRFGSRVDESNLFNGGNRAHNGFGKLHFSEGTRPEGRSVLRCVGYSGYDVWWRVAK